MPIPQSLSWRKTVVRVLWRTKARQESNFNIKSHSRRCRSRFQRPGWTNRKFNNMTFIITHSSSCCSSRTRLTASCQIRLSRSSYSIGSDPMPIRPCKAKLITWRNRLRITESLNKAFLDNEWTYSKTPLDQSSSITWTDSITILLLAKFWKRYIPQLRPILCLNQDSSDHLSLGSVRQARLSRLTRLIRTLSNFTIGSRHSL